MAIINTLSLFFRENKLDVSCESSAGQRIHMGNQALLARQRIHMKNQALFSPKDKSKKLKSRLLQFLFGALRVSFPSRSVHFMSTINCNYKYNY